ncbi:MAG TPA: long-chain fatty acid--CoA ligase [Gemmatimonadales bacterium]
MTPTTLNQIFLSAAERYAGRPAVMRRKVDGAWRDLSYDTLQRRVRHLGATLKSLGLVPGDRVAILSENRPEWAIADYACLLARLVDVPIYTTLTPHQIGYILRDSGARAIFVSTRALLDKILEVRSDLPALEQIILFDGPPPTPDIVSFDNIEAQRADGANLGDWEREALAVTPDDLATLIYTSGTTGEPKGVMLSHGNITSNVVDVLRVLAVSTGDEYLSFLPLCHIFERMVGHFSMLQAGAVVSYATSFETVVAELPEVRPTIVASVPRLYEKIFTRVTDTAAAAGGLTHAIFEWARSTGEKRLQYVLAGRPVPWLLAIQQRVVDPLVFAKLRRRLGGRIHFLVSGGAPLNPAICRFFIAAGLPLIEGYGLTETSPVIAFNHLDKLRPGTVGPPLSGVEVRFAPDGEILVRGPNVMKGYYHKPEATAEAIDREGWFHTGDIGELDSEGCLRITDRKKDLIKTSGGKYVAPQPIEGMLKLNKYFSNAVMLGDKRRFPIMLVVPNFAALSDWLATEGLGARSPDELVAMPAVQERLEREARKSLRDLAQFETPKKFLLVARDFSIESGELTATLKVRRKVVEEHYRDAIEALYVEA